MRMIAIIAAIIAFSVIAHANGAIVTENPPACFSKDKMVKFLYLSRAGKIDQASIFLERLIESGACFILRAGSRIGVVDPGKPLVRVLSPSGQLVWTDSNAIRYY